jgi:putative spermidine/putrescine transport system substrate-binding protein
VKITRQQFSLGLGALALGASTQIEAALAASKPPMPKSPLTLSVMDVGGSLALIQRAIDKYAAAFPQYVSHVTYTKGTAPELPGKIKAEQSANALDIDLVLSGTDALASGIEQGLWLKVTPDYESAFPGYQQRYVPAALLMNGLAQGYGMLFTYTPSGPLLEYMPSRVSSPPANTDQLLAWTKAPAPRTRGPAGRFSWASPTCSRIRTRTIRSTGGIRPGRISSSYTRTSSTIRPAPRSRCSRWATVRST